MKLERLGRMNLLVGTYHLRRAEAGHVCHRYDVAELRDLRSEGLDIHLP